MKILLVEDNVRLSELVKKKYLHFKEGLEIHYDGDLPARTGMGSSSCFTVGLTKALYELKNKYSLFRHISCTCFHGNNLAVFKHIYRHNSLSITIFESNKIMTNTYFIILI